MLASCYTPFTLLHFTYRKSCSHACHPVPVLQADSQTARLSCTTCCRVVATFEIALLTATCRAVPILGTSIKRASEMGTPYSNRPNSPITICSAMNRGCSSRGNKIAARSSPAGVLSLTSSSQMHGKQGWPVTVSAMRIVLIYNCQSSDKKLESTGIKKLNRFDCLIANVASNIAVFLNFPKFCQSLPRKSGGAVSSSFRVKPP